MRFVIVLLAALTMFGGTSTRAADITGLSINSYAYEVAPQFTFVNPFSSSAVIGDGIEFSALIERIDGFYEQQFQIDLDFSSDNNNAALEVYISAVDTLPGNFNGFPVVGMYFTGLPELVSFNATEFRCTPDPAVWPGTDCQAAPFFNQPIQHAGRLWLDFSAVSAGSYARYEENSPVYSLPEPASWAMLLIGFGALGYTLRARRLMAAPMQRPFS